MKLCTLGQLRLEGQKFRREKPLLMLAYLALEGPKPRRFMAELFWPNASNAMNNLAVAINHLRKLNAAQADDSRVWAEVTCDALELREALRASQQAQAITLYTGAFAEGISLNDVGTELEEWLLETRENLAGEMRAALLFQAEQAIQQSNYAEAGRCTEMAYHIAGALPPEPEELPRFYHFLRAAEHPLAHAIEKEARELDIALEAPVIQTRQRLKSDFVGRDQEIEQLLALTPGQWAWIQGGQGMGKTALLQEMAVQHGCRIVPARTGLPFATLEPLLGEIDDNQTLLLRKLSELSEPLLLDDWENIDPESQALIQRLQSSDLKFPVMMTSSEAPMLTTDLQLELHPLTQQELSNHPDAYQATDGMPALVYAYLHNKPLEQALETRLAQLNEEERHLHAALTLLPEPDLTLVRRALGLTAATLVKIHEKLVTAGLLEGSGIVRSQSVASHALENDPMLTAQISLQLARQMPKETALPYYQRSQMLWEDEDIPQVSNAYAYWGHELLRRGFPKKAVDLLEDSPKVDELILLHARSLERSSLFKQALELINKLEPTPESQALKSRLLYKLSGPKEAKEIAESALGGSLEAEAEALNTLGEIALRSGEIKEAEELFGRTATLWQTIGNHSRWLGALNNRSIARTALGESVEKAFAETLEESKNNMNAKALALINMAQGYLRQNKFQQAEHTYHQVLQITEEARNLDITLAAWNGIGIMYHTRDSEKARSAYQAGLSLAQQTGDTRMTALLLANLAELNGDIPAWQQAIDLLERGGFQLIAKQHQESLKEFMKH